MATAEVAASPQQQTRPRRKPFTRWVKNLTNLKNKSGDQQDKSASKRNGLSGAKGKKLGLHNGTLKNNPYPKSGHHLQNRGQSPASSANGHLSFSIPETQTLDENRSLGSLSQDRDAHANSNRSGAPTLATNAGTIHSDAGHSKAATTTTHGGALSSIDGAGAGSTFSSPNQSQHSLTTTLTTIHSTSPGTTLQSAAVHPHAYHHGSLNNPNPVMFSHQYPVSPAPSTANAISAIPRHMADYNSATANGLLTDNASILTLASSSKRRRRSMDTDASVRALAPSSVFGGSRESLPLSVLSGNVETATTASGGGLHSQPRPSFGGLASAERASVYSSQGVNAASERNSYMSHRPGKDIADAKSLRSITNIDTRSLAGDAKSINADSKSVGGDVGSLKNESSIRSGAIGHGRSDSIPGSIGSPLTSPNSKHLSGTGALSRRSSDWQDPDVISGEEVEKDREEEEKEDLTAHDESDHPPAENTRVGSD